MSILWLIIKVILFALLGGVVLLITGLAIILLAPIHYEAYVEKYGELIYEIHFRYLKGIKGKFHLEDGIKHHRVDVFWKTLYEDKVEEVEVTEHSPQMKSFNKEPVQKNKNEKSTQTNRVLSDRINVNDKTSSDETKQVKKEKVLKKKVKSPIMKEIEDSTQESAEKVKEETKQKIREMPDSGIKEILLDPLTYRAVRCILKGIWSILKVMAPKEWDFEMVVGAGDPGETGALIAKLTLLYPIYFQHGVIRGDYEKECLMGGFLVKGRFRIGQIVIRLVQLYLQRDVRTFIHLILK
ncbi:MAG: hypothetical protein H9872_00930 [Candidatus Cellulosilyticum pullistercoris]|uniref:DUF2953 domain-containing protein n=1 Tax=Candidatus Cellulosilyticum pullistercoris TaxID=2838521 RepID=A0A9E2KAJ3_9FIRM|nr:hypothetical protein [Candidatus Cellulosilyticum pullistercoris]